MWCLSLIGVFLIFFLFVVWFVFWWRYSGSVEIIAGENSRALDFLKGTRKLYYFAHIIYGLFPMYNTYKAFISNKEKYRPEREILHGYDGGEFGIDWFENKKNPRNLEDEAPIVVVVHGVNGGSSESYVQKLCLRIARETNWRSVCYLFRGCCGTNLTTPVCYNGGFTPDLHTLLETLEQRYPKAPIQLVGYSLGGNMLTKYFGEQFSVNTPPILQFHHVKEHKPIPRTVRAAIAVGQPFDLIYMDKHTGHKIQLMVGEGTTKYIKKHEDFLRKNYKGFNNYEEFMAQSNREVRIFDEMITRRFFEYKSRDDFYRDLSSSRYLDGIGPHSIREAENQKEGNVGEADPHPVKMLFISARNDPLSLYGGIPEKSIKQNKNLACLVTPGGGHLGFFSCFSSAKLFDEDTILKFLAYEFGLVN